MGVDVNELANRLGWTPKAVAEAAAIVRAVLADELAKREAAQPEPAAEGDVPKWFMENLSINFRLREWQQAESELARRVAEAVAEKDKRIAELRKFKDYVHGRLDSFAVPENPEPQITDATGCRIGPRLDWVFSRFNDKTQQLAASQGEVDRLTKSSKKWWDAANEEQAERGAALRETDRLREEVARLTRPVAGVDWKLLYQHMLHVQRMPWADTIQTVVEPLLQAERNAREAADQRAAIAEDYTRGFAQLAFTLCRRWHADEGHAAKNVNECRQGWCGEFAQLGSETNAVDVETAGLLHDRAVAAEAERDELREAVNEWCRHKFLVSVNQEGQVTPELLAEFHKSPVDAVLAAFRAQKGKVQA